MPFPYKLGPNATFKINELWSLVYKPSQKLKFLLFTKILDQLLLSFLGEHHIFLKDTVSLMVFPYYLGQNKTFKIHGLYS